MAATPLITALAVTLLIVGGLTVEFAGRLWRLLRGAAAPAAVATQEEGP